MVTAKKEAGAKVVKRIELRPNRPKFLGAIPRGLAQGEKNTPALRRGRSLLDRKKKGVSQ